MHRRLVAMLAMVAWGGCASTPNEQFRACSREKQGYFRTGTVVGKTEDGRYRFQADDLPKDGRHILIYPDCFGTLERPCVFRNCKLIAGTTAERNEPLTEPDRPEEPWR